MRDLVDFIARALVDHPEEIEVRELDRGRRIELRVSPSDLGKMIGRKGQTAKAMRALLQAGAREGRGPELDISDGSETSTE